MAKAASRRETTGGTGSSSTGGKRRATPGAVPDRAPAGVVDGGPVRLRGRGTPRMRVAPGVRPVTPPVAPVANIQRRGVQAGTEAGKPARKLTRVGGRYGKYGAIKTEYGGQVYDSKTEAEFARDLDLKKRAGVIHDWGRSEPYLLIPAVKRTKTKAGLRAVSVCFDFWVIETPGGPKIEIDTKGSKSTISQAFRLRLRLFRHFYPDVEVRVIGRLGETIRV